MKLPPDDITLARLFRGLVITQIAWAILIELPLTSLEHAVTNKQLDRLGLNAEIIGTEPPSYTNNTQLPEISIAVNLGTVSLKLYLVASLFAGSILYWIGLLKFQNWSRWLHLGIFIAKLFWDTMLHLGNFSYRWDLANTIYVVYNYIDILILALAFLSPVANRFTDHKTPDEMPREENESKKRFESTDTCPPSTHLAANTPPPRTATQTLTSFEEYAIGCTFGLGAVVILAAILYFNYPSIFENMTDKRHWKSLTPIAGLIGAAAVYLYSKIFRRIYPSEPITPKPNNQQTPGDGPEFPQTNPQPTEPQTYKPN